MDHLLKIKKLKLQSQIMKMPYMADIDTIFRSPDNSHFVDMGHFKSNGPIDAILIVQDEILQRKMT